MRGGGLSLSTRKAARLAVQFVILGTAAVTLAGYSGYAMFPTRALPADPAAFVNALESQIPNRAVKTDRLAALIPTKLASAGGATYALASVSSTTEYDRDQDRVPGEMTTQALPYAEPPLATHKAEPKLAALPPAAADKAKRLLPPPPPAPAPGAFLDDGQIAGIKTRLRLTADQAEYWPAVEAALRDVVRTQLREGHLKHSRGKPNIDVNAPEVQKLLYVAMPLLMRLREDQKSEVRKLARVIGLESVASQI